ncbi:MAG TPA: Hsp20/alpha crystallin family protein [Acidimicrobiales bacterium]|nr:Hsp20/alpha crystallin family protein [Acidimicrobiales bacterium]
MEEAIHEGILVIRAELPGVDPEKDVELVVENGILSLRADRREESETKGEKQRHTEFRYGHFERTMALPVGTTEEDVKATYENGILEVRVPIDGEKAEARKVPITRT